jgi:adenylyltransferase/sulfurtransferase
MKGDFLERYSRQIVLRELGLDGQKTLSGKRVLVVGLGALGSVATNILARLGVGFLRLVDRDFVELNNLHRQILYYEEDAFSGVPKAELAAERVRRINSDVEVEAVVDDVNYRSIERLVKDIDIIIDGTDNFETRFLVNDAALKYGIPWVYGSAIRTYGMVMNIVPGETACLRCFIRDPPPPGSLPTCETIGVLSTITHIVPAIQVTEAIKILLGREFSRDLFVIDVWTHDFVRARVDKRDDCPACSLGIYEFLGGRGQKTTVLCGTNSIQILPDGDVKLDLRSLGSRLKDVGRVEVSDTLLRLSIPPYEMAIFSNGRVIIKGTTDEKVARALYSKYVGI